MSFVYLLPGFCLLFSEELAYALRDSGYLLIRNGECLLAGNAARIDAPKMPETVEGIIASRVDRLAADEQLTLKIASGLTYVTRTARSGIYRVRGLGKQVKLEDVVISCTKDGYQQTRVVRRPPTRGKTVKSVETECRMQRN